MTIFFKKGAIGWQIRKKGVIGCETAHNLGNLTHFFEIFGAICKFANFARTFQDWKSKNRGSLGVKLCKRGHPVTNRWTNIWKDKQTNKQKQYLFSFSVDLVAWIWSSSFLQNLSPHPTKPWKNKQIKMLSSRNIKSFFEYSNLC